MFAFISARGSSPGSISLFRRLPPWGSQLTGCVLRVFWPAVSSTAPQGPKAHPATAGAS